MANIVVDSTKTLKKDWDYTKNEQWNIMLSQNFVSLSVEKQRTIGAEVFSLLAKEVEGVHLSSEWTCKHFLEGLILASYRFDRFLSKPEKVTLNTVVMPKQFKDHEMDYLTAIQEAVFWTRDMVNLPVSHLNAVQFAEEIKKWCQDKHCSVEVLNHAKIKSMKSDMAGAAMVVGAIKALSLLNIPVHVIGLIPATDNRPGGNAYAPGDIVTMYNKSTVEVLNTDAEGRMILADALSYADKFEPALVVSAATLTGAAVRAIGTKAAIAMGNAPKNVMDALVDSGLKTHERLVEFPFWDEYLTPMKSEIADLKNIGGPDAGMITAGKFLETFVKSPYIHLDVAGPTWQEQRSGYLPKGGSGFGVRLLLEFLTNYHQWKKNEN